MFGGDKFSQAKVAVAIMVLYPMHQTYGQLTASLFYATGQTRVYRNIGLIFMAIGLPLTFFVLAPNRLFGLDLGSAGIGIKMVLIQVIGVNVNLWFNTKYLKISFMKFIWHQLDTVLILALLSGLCVTLIDNLIESQIISFIVSGIIYTILTIGVLFIIPQMFSLSSCELNLWKKKLLYRTKIKGIKDD